MGKENNQTSVSDADREIPTIGSKDNAGNEVKTSFPALSITLGLGFISLHRGPIIDSIFLAHWSERALKPKRPGVTSYIHVFRTSVIETTILPG